MRRWIFCLLAALMAAVAPAAMADMPAVTGTMALDYAEHFTLAYCEGGYQLITVLDNQGGETRFLTVPEGAQAPENLDDDVTVLKLPLRGLLVSSNPVISLINAAGALDAVALTTTAREDFCIPEAQQAMDAGALAYVGEYDAMDYEVLAAEQPPLAVFSAMLLSAPDVAQKLTELGIPTLLDASSYEGHPLARVEWVRLFGALLGCQEQADAVYAAQKEQVEALPQDATGKTVAVFYITSSGSLYARNGGDYMARMVELAGGDYVLAEMNPEKSGTQKMEMEEFYVSAGEADVILYVWSMGGRPQTLQDLLERGAMLSEFKAVKEGQVFCTSPEFFQISDTIGSMIVDIRGALEGQDDMTYLFRLQ